jgi:hypothetical protein
MATRLERYGLPANAAARVASHGARNRLLDDAALRTATADYPAVTDTHPYTEYPLARFMRGERFYANPTFLFESAGRAPELGKDF